MVPHALMTLKVVILVRVQMDIRALSVKHVKIIKKINIRMHLFILIDLLFKSIKLHDKQPM